ncbi:hypothetical protein KAH94_04105 [bacterium]|nr:hypothetical protein [bacterium]
MNDLRRILSQSLRWVGFEAVSYQALLLGHQMLLFKVSDCLLYGFIGTVFSFVYLFVSVADFGLESSVSPFFSQLCKSRSAFQFFLTRQLLPGIIFTFFLVVGFLAVSNWLQLTFLPPFMLLVLGLLVLSETVKKTLRTVLHLAFLNQQVAFLEIGTIVSYIATVWVFYGLGASVSLFLIFVPMVVTSVASMVVMSLLLYRFSLTLPQGKVLLPSYFRIFKSRGFNFLNQLSHTFFSSNFLVPFFALQFGLAQAGLFKLISHIAYAITSIVKKTFGLTSDALLAKTKQMDSSAKREAFSFLTQRLHHALYGVFIFFFINYNKLLSHSAYLYKSSEKSLIFLFFLICLSENFFIAYEKLFITFERIGRLFAFNLFTMILTYGVISFSSKISLVGALFSIVVVRVFIFALMSVVSFYTWNIVPNWKLNLKYLLAILFGSLLFFVFF